MAGGPWDVREGGFVLGVVVGTDVGQGQAGVGRQEGQEGREGRGIIGRYWTDNHVEFTVVLEGARRKGKGKGRHHGGSGGSRGGERGYSEWLALVCDPTGRRECY